MVFSFAGQLITAGRAAAAGAREFRLAARLIPLTAALLAIAATAHAQDDAAEQEALSAKGVSGEIMDMAVEHCRRGEKAQALSMFGAIRTQLEPPPAILRLIEDLEATGCSGPQALRGGTLRLQLGGGWDSNVSQGISARSLVVGSGENLLELQLDESYRPRSSSFVQAAADWGLLLPGTGLNLQAGMAYRKNARESAFDVTAASAAVSREFALRQSALRARLELSEVWLGNRHYQRSQSAGMEWLVPGTRGAWLATLSTTSLHYLTQPSQNAWQWEAGILREQRVNAAQSVFAGVSLQLDNATGARPGGDRQGFQVQVGGVVLAQGWRFRPQLSYTQWQSAEVFAPGLLDVRRRNELGQVSFQAERPLDAKTSLVLEWRGRSARDTVALYRYKAQSFSAALAHRF